MEYISPIDAHTAAPIPFAPRPDSLAGKRIALLDITKKRGAEFLDRIEALVRAQGAEAFRISKETLSKPASTAVVDRVVAEADAVIEALADCGSCTSGIVHDAVRLEQRGVPTAAVATEVFLDEALEQAKVLGMPDYRVVLIPHPVQLLTTAELHSRADAAFDLILVRLGQGQHSEAALQA